MLQNWLAVLSRSTKRCSRRSTDCDPRRPHAKQPMASAPPDSKSKGIKDQEAFYLDLIGLHRADIAPVLEANGIWSWRIVAIDGKSRPVGLDVRPGRLNLSISSGRVTGISVDGRARVLMEFAPTSGEKTFDEDSGALADETISETIDESPIRPVNHRMLV